MNVPCPTVARACLRQHSDPVEKLVWPRSVKCLFPSLSNDNIKNVPINVLGYNVINVLEHAILSLAVK